LTTRLTALLSDETLMADRGRLAIIDERLSAVLAALNAECAILRDTFTACADITPSAWPQIPSEQATHDRVSNLYALHNERMALTDRRNDLARVVLPRTHLA